MNRREKRNRICIYARFKHKGQKHIAHIIRQLVEKGIKEIKELKLKLKEISQHIKKELISTTINLKVQKRVQLRFD